MINLRDNELLIRCSCYSNDHSAFLIYEPDDSRGNNIKGIDDDWYLSVMLDHFIFWKRVKLAFKYIFAPYSIRYGMSTELVLKNEDMDKIVNFINVRRGKKPTDEVIDEIANTIEVGYKDNVSANAFAAVVRSFKGA